MPAKKDPRIDTAIAEAAPFARPIMTRLRALIHKACPGVEETIKWSHPSFVLDGQILCAIGTFKAHMTFGFWHHGMEKVIAADGEKNTATLGLIGRGRITSMADLPDDQTLLRYIKAAAALNASDQPSRPPSKPRPQIPTPPDLAAALKKNQTAAAATRSTTIMMMARFMYYNFIGTPL